jgi:DnaJ-class molecular chaperone
MTFAESPRPVAYCAGCYMPSLSAQTGMACTNAGCNGFFVSAVDANEWTKCAACDGIGRVEAAYCRACHGTGWVPTTAAIHS